MQSVQTYHAALIILIRMIIIITTFSEWIKSCWVVMLVMSPSLHGSTNFYQRTLSWSYQKRFSPYEVWGRMVRVLNRSLFQGSNRATELPIFWYGISSRPIFYFPYLFLLFLYFSELLLHQVHKTVSHSWYCNNPVHKLILHMCSVRQSWMNFQEKHNAQRWSWE